MKKFAPILMLTACLTGCQSVPEETSTAGSSTAPKATSTASTNQDASLYEDLGKRDGISRIIADMLYIIVDDQRIGHHFKGLDISKLHRNLTDFICRTSGGPCDYTGNGMVAAHEGMNISETAFNALVNNLVLAMEKNGISVSAKNRLLARLAPLHDKVVGH